MVLAAGRGTLGAVEQQAPLSRRHLKFLTGIGGRPAYFAVQYLELEGVTRVIVNCHHLAHHAVERHERVRTGRSGAAR